MSKRPFLPFVLALLFLWPAHGQEPRPQKSAPKSDKTAPAAQPPTTQGEQDEVVRITTNLVQIDAVVTKGNKAVTDLKQGDFEVLQDGKRQIITSFSYVPSVLNTEKTAPTSTKATNALLPPPPFKPSEPHRTIAFVYDDIGSSAETVASVRNQIRKFVEDEMLPNDLVAIIRTGGEVGALQQFTNDKRILLRAIENLRWHTGSRVGLSIFPTASDVGSGPPGGAVTESVTALKFILLGMREIPGRKSMILLTENLPTQDPAASLPSALITAAVPAVETTPVARDSDSMFSNYRGVQNLAELAIRSSVVIYGVDIRGLVPYEMMTGGMQIRPSTRPVGDQPFGMLAAQRQYLHSSRQGQDYLAQQTGGFVIRNSNTYLKPIIDDQSGYYLLGYRPTETTFDRKLHKISVRLKRSGLTVRTRAGFYGMTDEDTRPEITNHDRLNIALMSPLGASDIEVRLTAMFAAAPKAGSQLSSLIHFSGRELEFRKEPDGRHQATLNLAAIVFGDNGKVIEQVTETRSIRVNDKDLDRLLAGGLVYQIDVPLRKPGAYQFRVAVRDEGSSQIGTARQFVEIPDLTKGLLTLSGITVSSDAPATERGPQDLMSAAVRRFALGSNLWFGYTIYNARTEKATNAPTLTAQSRILRDGKLVFTGEPQPIDFTGQSDLNRVSTGGGLKLGTLPVGEYHLQIVVRDLSEKQKPRVAWQQIDFEIVK